MLGLTAPMRVGSYSLMQATIRAVFSELYGVNSAGLGALPLPLRPTAETQPADRRVP